MKSIPFKSSADGSLGVELEFQLVNPFNFDLISKSKDLIRNVAEGPFGHNIKPEITQSMIEINSDVHLTPQSLEKEFEAIHEYLVKLGDENEIEISGGGTHAFQQWASQKIFPIQRYKNLLHIYRYLSKRATVFGQHIHIGCNSGDNAIYLTHAFSRFAHHFIVLSASSPFYQGINTGFNSSRLTVLNAFPQSGVMPLTKTWAEFLEYFNKMRRLKIVKTMKDFYWDCRPKPEYGTVEIRVCDTPLTMKRAAMIAAYAQMLAAYILEERPVEITKDLYDVYSYNRFQAARYGYSGRFIHPFTLKNVLIAEDMQSVLMKLKKYAKHLGTTEYLSMIEKNILEQENDTAYLKDFFHETGDLSLVVKQECKIWKANKKG